MDFKTQTNNSQAPQQQPSAPLRPSANNQKQSSSRKTLGLVIGLVIAIALVVVGLLVWQTKSTGASGISGIEENKYQAVFLTNGQVYFGDLTASGKEYVELSNVYYLQVQQEVQPAAEKTGEQPQVSLTKLGNELHGPTDKMHISKDQVLFWENLKDDSTVVKAINDYQSKR